MDLNLKNPIIFFDLETTGLDIAKDRILEIAYVKVYPNGNEESACLRIKPTDDNGNVMHIPAESTAVHGITDEAVANCPTFKEVAKKIGSVFEGSDLGGYNSARFDLPLLAEEFARVGVDINLAKRKMVDVQTIFHKMEQRTLIAAYKFYCKKDLVGAHGALADTKATYEVLKAQLDRYPDLQNDIAFLADYTCPNKYADFAGRIAYNAQGEEVVNFGKYKGHKVVDVLRNDPGYYGWIMQADFPLTTKQVFTRLKLSLK